MNREPEPKDHTEVLKQLSTRPDNTEPQYVMCERNKKRLEKMRQRVKQLRGK